YSLNANLLDWLPLAAQGIGPSPASRLHGLRLIFQFAACVPMYNSHTGQSWAMPLIEPSSF
ncbi:Dnaj Subfamily C Member 13, partial [Manis pentadactyla]